MASLGNQKGVARQAHHMDLWKTQQQQQGLDQGDVVVLINFPASDENRSCQNTQFNTAYVRLTRDQILETGSSQLKESLEEAEQFRERKHPEPLPEGTKYVLHMKPPTEADEHTIALQRLSITKGIKLWHRSMALGVSVAAAAGHDDYCLCDENWDVPYTMVGPPESIRGAHVIDNLNFAVYLFDTESWGIDQHRDINDFCLIRQTANLVRLFRSIAKDDLHIDSAPRMWTLVGLFKMLGMKNHDLLSDRVTTWFNNSNNLTFVELLPEETIRVATTLKAPSLAEPAFRILVNERALAVAGGNTQSKNVTIFGRRVSDCLTGTDDMEEIAQKIEHAGVAMADRYKKALDDLCCNDTLAILNVQEFKELIAVGNVLPDNHDVHVSYFMLLHLVRAKFREAVDRVINKAVANLPGTDADIGAALSYLVPKGELEGGHSFAEVYATLNKGQRALCPLLWLGLQKLTMTDFDGLAFTRLLALSFGMDFKDAKKQHKLLPGQYPAEFDTLEGGFIDRLFENSITKLKIYVEPLVSRSAIDFKYKLHPHMVLCLDEKEMDYISFENQTSYEVDIPEAELGPSGPGPSFHTGITLPSVSESLAEEFEKLDISAGEGSSSTNPHSVVVQDGISTVYDRRQVLTPSASIDFEGFTDDAMSADSAEAESAM
ncbi:hypothetical protein VPNG_01698 [Cytospora leucostoma]|uniref:Uncharacterized protein n=1 Tax=Cytospora leucostoma TaxID=1230097 RepID=A0A423XL51_9PEZI|nr:hypothetical protein VPNG_01698 [Cytospora leucostoma]